MINSFLLGVGLPNESSPFVRSLARTEQLSILSISLVIFSFSGTLFLRRLTLPNILDNKLLKSCAIPDESLPIVSNFCDCKSLVSRAVFNSLALKLVMEKLKRAANCSTFLIWEAVYSPLIFPTTIVAICLLSKMQGVSKTDSDFNKLESVDAKLFGD